MKTRRVAIEAGQGATLRALQSAIAVAAVSYIGCSSGGDKGKTKEAASAVAVGDEDQIAADKAKLPDDPVKLVKNALVAACDAGELERCRSLGVLYAEGAGVPRDLARAQQLYTKACDGGLMSACSNLALVYSEGLGVEVDPKRAEELFRRSCDGGHFMACRNLGIMYAYGRGVGKDSRKAASLFKKACEGGAVNACNNLGLFYIDGLGVDKDETRAIGLFKRACDARDPSACRNLGLAYLAGRGVPRGSAPAKVWLERGCDGGDAVGCRALGALYADGAPGIVEDEKKAKKFLGFACRKLDQPACELLLKKGWARMKEKRKGAAPRSSRSAKAQQK